VAQDPGGQNRLMLKKQIVTDEAMKPVAVIINYQDWQQIEAMLQRYWEEQNDANSPDVSAALASYAGSITLTLDPLEYQQQERNAWL
jgi:PHD/YefM family antitoxin component YafN of YafNO toxin-antitoxin module